MLNPPELVSKAMDLLMRCLNRKPTDILVEEIIPLSSREGFNCPVSMVTFSWIYDGEYSWTGRTWKTLVMTADDDPKFQAMESFKK